MREVRAMRTWLLRALLVTVLVAAVALLASGCSRDVIDSYWITP